MNKIAVTVTCTEKELKDLLIGGFATDIEITDKAKMKKIFNSKRFAKDLAYDLKYVWSLNVQDDPSYELIESLGLDACTSEQLTD